MKKKKSRRSEAEYPALDSKFNLKTRSDLLDIDYLDQLSDKEKQWLNDFHTEYTNADFKTNVEEGRKRIHRKRKVDHPRNQHLKKLLNDFYDKITEFVGLINSAQIKNSSRTKFKKTLTKFKKTLKKQIKDEFQFIKDYYKTDSETSNNKRNHCILTKQKAQNQIRSLDYMSEGIMSKSTEDQLIDLIDAKRKEESDA